MYSGGPDGEQRRVGRKTRVTAAVLAFTLGAMGIHRFYIGHYGVGLLQLLMFLAGIALPLSAFFVDDPGAKLALAAGGLLGIFAGIWAAADGVLIIAGKFKDREGFDLA